MFEESAFSLSLSLSMSPQAIVKNMRMTSLFSFKQIISIIIEIP